MQGNSGERSVFLYPFVSSSFKLNKWNDIERQDLLQNVKKISYPFFIM